MAAVACSNRLASAFCFNGICSLNCVKSMDHRITAIQVQKRNSQRVSIFLDGEYAFGLSRIVAAWLVVGQEISDDKIAQLKAEDETEVVYLKTLNFIQYRPRSSQEIRRYLMKHNTPEPVVEQTVERLQRAGLVDDARFAQAWVENRTDLRPRSRQALAFELRQRGINSQTINDALEEIDDDTLALDAARKQARRYQELEWQDFRQKMCSFLARRGFNYSASMEATKQVWSEINAEQTPDDEEYG